MGRCGSARICRGGRSRCRGRRLSRRWDGGLCDDWPCGRLRCNRWGGWRRSDHNSRLLPRLRDNPTRGRCWGRGNWRRSTLGGSCRGPSDNRRCRNCLRRLGGRWRDGWTRRRSGRRGFLFTSQNFAHRIAGLGNLRPVNLGLLSVAGRALPIGSASAAALQIDAHTFGFVALKRTRVGLLFGYANCRQSIQDFPALDFQFARQIIDSNFTHPPL